MKTLAEVAAPEGKKAARQDNADRAASGGKYGVPTPPGARASVN